MAEAATNFSPSTKDVLSQMYGTAQDIAKEKPATANLEPAKKELTKASAAADQLSTVTMPKAPAINTKLPGAPAPPTGDSFDVFKQMGPAMLVLASGLSRRHAGAAITSAAAMMNAYHNGQTEQYEQARQKWKDDTQQLLDQTKLELDDFHTRMEESKGKTDLILANATAHGSLFKDETQLAMAQAGNSDAILKHNESKLKAYEDIHKSMIDQQKADQAAVKYQATLSEDTLRSMAQQYLKGVPKAQIVSNLGRGTQGSANVVAFNNMVTEVGNEMGLNPAQIADKVISSELIMKGKESAARAEGRMEQQTTAASNILDQSLPSLMGIADKYQLSPSTDLNKFYNFVMTHGSAEDKTNFSTQLRAVTTDYAMLIGRGRITVHSDQEALKVLNDDMGISSLKGFEKAAMQETKNIKQGLKKTSKDLFGGGDDSSSKDDNVVHWDDLK